MTQPTSSDDASERSRFNRINVICNRFERAWKADEPLSIEAAAAGVESTIRSSLIQHLAELDIEYRMARGQNVEIESYLVRWPDLDEDALRDVQASSRSETAASINQSTTQPSGTLPRAQPEVTLPPAEFLHRLRQRGLLSEEEISTVIISGSSGPPQDVAARFVSAGLLTPWQCQAVSGRCDDPLLLDEYVLVDQIGRGGMGTVYRARHRRMKRTVALKVLRRDIPNAEMVAKRFLREVEVAAKLIHPNIVTAFDAGESQGVSYLVTEYVDGQNLSELVRQYGPLSLTVAFDVIHQAARALAYAHREGIIHRDIKPSNLLIDDAGTVKLLDVGLARINQPDDQPETNDSDLTTTGMVMGTPDYMSPEQALNTRLAAEPSDIYSLGCTLFFLITGRPPYARGSTMERLLAHREQPIPRLQSFSDQIPAAVDRLLHQMLAKSVKDRLSTMQRLVEQIDMIRSSGLPDVTLPLDAVSGESMTEASIAEQTLQSRDPEASAAEQHFALPDRRSINEDTVPVMDSRVREPIAQESPALIPSTASPGAKLRTKQKAQRSSGFGQKAILIGIAVFAGITTVGLYYGGGGSDLVSSPNVWPATQNLTEMAEADVQRYRSEWANLAKLPLAMTLEGVSLELVPPGEFLFGPPDSPVSTTITAPFYLGTAEITVGEFRRFAESRSWVSVAEREATGWGVDPESGQWVQGPGYSWKSLGDQAPSEQLPAASIAYRDAEAYCLWMSTISGRTVRLPSEEEWEYACRSGRNVSWCFGNDPALSADFASTRENSGLRLLPVRSKRPSPWGLFDLHGNESEWCLTEDAAEQEYSGEGTVRGGGFYSSIDETRCWVRSSNPLQSTSHGAFRILVEVPPVRPAQ